MRVSAGVLAGWLALAVAGPVAAATRAVTLCTDTGAAGEVRQVLQAAADGDLIVLPACTIKLASRLDVGEAVSFQGAGAGRTILDGNGVTSVMAVSVAPSDLLRISDLSIVGGEAGAGFGGGLLLGAGNVHLDGVEISGNRAVRGGGIYATGGVLTVTRSRIVGNRTATGGSGGGLFVNAGSATLAGTAVLDNHADGLGGRGGGIFHGGSLLVVSESLIARNTALDARGGGIFWNVGRLLVTSTTIEDNEAARGGALWSGGAAGALLHATVSGNSATENGGALDIFVGDLVLQSSILAYNTAPLGRTCSTTTTVGTAGHNLADDATCGLGGPGDRQGLDPLLGALADNGGPTATRALLTGSPAVDTADPVGCPGTDQRGTARPQGESCDIGAFEVVPVPAPPEPPVNLLSLSPPTGTYLSTQVMDFTIIVDAPGRSVVDGLVMVDGLDFTPAVVDCVRVGALAAGGQTFHCPGVPAGVLGTGPHTVAVSLVLDDGTSLSREVVWEILPAVAP